MNFNKKRGYLNIYSIILINLKEKGTSIVRNRNKYELSVLNKFNYLLKVFLPVALLGTLIIMILLNLNKFDLILNIFFSVSSLILVFLIIFREKIFVLYIVYTFVLLSILGASLIILRVGFDLGGIIIYIMGATIVFGLFSKRSSYLFMIISTLMLIGTAFFTSKEHLVIVQHSIHQIIFEHYIFWSITIILYLIFCILLYIIIHSIKDDLIKSLYKAEQANKEIERLAYYDTLTQLPNIFLLEDKFKALKQKDGFVALLSIKGVILINSVYGHTMTNKVMEKTGYYITKISNQDDYVGRIGNDFFWFIKAKSKEIAEMAIHNFITLMHHGSDTFGVEFKVLFKVGIVHVNNSSASLEEWIRKAYSSLEKSRTSSKKIISWYDQETEDALKKEELLMEALTEAVENQEFSMYYQEKVDSRINKVVGVEALVRWHSSVLGPVSPNEFLPLIERLQLSVSFGEEVLRLVSEDYEKLIEKYHEDLLISINISPHHLSYEGFVDFLREHMVDNGVCPSTIILEITEDNLIKDLDLIEPVLSNLHFMGFKLSIDDFGTGYSSLNYLTKLNVDEVKIDQTFILNMLEDERTKKLVKAIISLKKIYGFDIIAEGVENKEISDVLKDMDCFIHQGFYYSKPQPIN